MSGTKSRYNISKMPNQSIAVSQCGLTEYEKGQEVKTRVYGHYAVHFILKGKGFYTINGKTFELGAGQGFLIPPNVPNTYRADENEPWTYIYAIFYGLDDEALVHYSGFDSNNLTFSYEMTEDMLHDLYAMYQAGENTGTKGYDVTGHFLVIMSRLVKDKSERLGDSYLPEHYVAKAISYMEDNYPYDIKISDIAEIVGINRVYLHKLFVKNTGIGPARYLMECRLKKAETLMEHEELSLGDIALSTGFYDVSHFSKAFTSKHGISPGKYRLNKKEEKERG